MQFASLRIVLIASSAKNFGFYYLVLKLFYGYLLVKGGSGRNYVFVSKGDF